MYTFCFDKFAAKTGTHKSIERCESLIIIINQDEVYYNPRFSGGSGKLQRVFHRPHLRCRCLHD